METTKQAKHHSFKKVTLAALPDELGVMEATYVSGCSTHFITRAIEAGELKARRIAIRTRLVWRIKKEDFLEFHRERVQGNTRINHLKHRARNRQSVISKGYRKVHNPGHPRADLHGYVSEHLLVYEKRTGRKVPYGKDIHHINGDKLDNRFENLELFSSRSKHLKNAHGLEHSVRKKLAWLFASRKLKPESLTDEQKVEFMDILIKAFMID